jgi:hypothetical protein
MLTTQCSRTFIMKVPKISLVAALSVFLLLSCLLGNVAGLAWRQHPGRYRVVRGNRLIEARQLDGEPDDGYGPPPPYYTGEPVVPVDTTSGKRKVSLILHQADTSRCFFKGGHCNRYRDWFIQSYHDI